MKKISVFRVVIFISVIVGITVFFKEKTLEPEITPLFIATQDDKQTAYLSQSEKNDAFNLQSMQTQFFELDQQLDQLKK